MNFPFECRAIVLQVLINLRAMLIDFESTKEFDQNFNDYPIHNTIEGYASANVTASDALYKIAVAALQD